MVAVILLLNLFGRFFVPGSLESAWPPGLPVLFGLVACVVWIVVVNRLSLKEVREGLLNRKYLDFGFLVVAVMVFKGVLDRSGVIGGINDELTAYHIPVLLIIVILPFISGKDYFQATIPASYKMLLKPVLGVMVLTALYVSLLLRL